MNGETGSKSRVYSTVNGLRGVAALAVATHHGQGFFGRWMAEGGYRAVDLFFVLSGFVLAHAYERRFETGMTTRAFFWIRLRRFYPLYLVGVLIGSLSAAVAWKLDTGTPAPFGLVRTIGFGLFMLPYPTLNPDQMLYPVNVPAWSLFFELVINVVYVAFRRRLSTPFLLLTVPLAGAMLAVVGMVHGSLDLGSRWGSFGGGLLRVYFSFFAGVLIFRLFPHAGTRSILSWGLLALSIVLVVAWPKGPVRVGFDLVCVLLLLPAIVALAVRFEPSKRARSVFETLGAISFPLYAIHYPILEFASRVLRATGSQPAAVAPWAGVVLLVAICFASVLLDRFYDGPVQQALRYFPRRASVEAS